MTDERWLPVVGYEGSYEISNYGRVKSLPRHGVRRAEKVLTPIRQHRGHLMVNLYGGETANKWGWTPHFIHHLVLDAFIGPCPEESSVCRNVCRHLNGDPADNRPENLAWGTDTQNQLDSIDHGTHWQSRKAMCARGHEFDSENTYWWAPKDGSRRPSRRCRKCNRENALKHKRGLRVS